MKRIPYTQHHFPDFVVQEACKILRSSHIGQGHVVKTFEEALATYLNAQAVVVVSSGTAALYIAYFLLKKEKGKVLLPSLAFAANANMLIHNQLTPCFVDIEKDSLCMQTQDKSQWKNIQGIVILSFAGYPLNLEALWYWCQQHHCWLIEDASHALGSFYYDSRGEKILCGSARYSHIAILSFHPTKLITTGEGGALIFQDSALAKEARKLRNHGFENQNHLQRDIKTPGFNFRMTDFQAALGLAQLRYIETLIEQRQQLAQLYYEQLKNTSYHLFFYRGRGRHAHLFFPIWTEKKDNLINYLEKHHIGFQFHYIPLHHFTFFRQTPRIDDLANTEWYYRGALSIPFYPHMKKEDQDKVIHTLLQFLETSS